ncbi:MAG: ZPR1 zinc finger domain-containing protein [Thermoproteales archaeon]|nr:ZPR1 zinc finger domain-containing protein [Thermoproteales archaeon]
MNNETIFVEYKNTYTEICPMCGDKTFKINEVIHLQPHLGRTLIVSKLCEKCGYKKTEIIPLEIKKRKIIVYKATEKKDLYSKIVRTSTATIYIPELGAVIEPGVDAPVFITNIEGILSRIEDAIDRIRVLEDNRTNDEEVTRIREYIAKVKQKGGELTIIIDDPTGLSKIIAKESAGKIVIEYVEGR